MNYALHLIIYLSIYGILAISLNMIVGYCGLLSLAHAGYFSLGAYTYALASMKLGWGLLPGLTLAIILAAILSLALSVPSWRLRGHFFVLISLAVQSVFFGLLYNWAHPGAEPGTLVNLTNGPFGLAGIPKPILLGFRMQSIGEVAFLAAALALMCVCISWLLVSSPWGRLLKSMRDDELALRNLGKNVRRVKCQVFAIACGMAAVAGVVYSGYVGYVDPSSASLDESILLLCMVLVGGAGNVRGPLVGALILLAIPEVLRFAHIADAAAANIRLILYGVALILIVHFRPQGLAGEYRIE